MARPYGLTETVPRSPGPMKSQKTCKLYAWNWCDEGVQRSQHEPKCGGIIFEDPCRPELGFGVPDFCVTDGRPLARFYLNVVVHARRGGGGHCRGLTTPASHRRHAAKRRGGGTHFISLQADQRCWAEHLQSLEAPPSKQRVWRGVMSQQRGQSCASSTKRHTILNAMSLRRNRLHVSIYPVNARHAKNFFGIHSGCTTMTWGISTGYTKLFFGIQRVHKKKTWNEPYFKDCSENAA